VYSSRKEAVAALVSTALPSPTRCTTIFPGVNGAAAAPPESQSSPAAATVEAASAAVQATRIGALAFLEKPITMQKLLKAVDQGLARKPAAPERPILGVVPSHPVSQPLLSPVMVQAQPAASRLPASVQNFDLSQPLREARDAFEKAYFEFHLAQEGGSMTRVAEKTGLERTHLYRKLKQLGVDLSRSKRGGV
jgi:DNA-binding NtrC family response regulator